MVKSKPCSLLILNISRHLHKAKALLAHHSLTIQHRLPHKVTAHLHLNHMEACNSQTTLRLLPQRPKTTTILLHLPLEVMEIIHHHSQATNKIAMVRIHRRLNSKVHLRGVVTLALPKVDIQVLPVNKVVMDNSNRITHKITMGNRKVDIPHQDIDGSAASQPASGHWNTNDITKLDYIYIFYSIGVKIKDTLVLPYSDISLSFTINCDFEKA